MAVGRSTPTDGRATVPVRPAATIMLVRDADPVGSGIEVCMLRRNLQSEFVGGAHVFPGGAVDDHDGDAEVVEVCPGRTDAEASARLGIDRGGLAYWVAAIRECFEEAGLLLARDGSGALVDLGDPAVDARFIEHRRAVDHGERRLVDVCRAEGLQLAVDAIYYFSHWITPVGPPRRYDTRFFVAAAPPGQVALHDDREVIANEWVRPADALARHRAGAMDLIEPTVYSLAALDRFATAAEVIAAAAALDVIPAILPKIIEAPGGYRLVLPGDEGYDEVVVAGAGVGGSDGP